MTRNRDKKGTLLKRGKKRKLYLVQWSDGDRRPSHKLGWCDEMTKSQAERAMRQYMEKINSHREVASDSVTLESFFQEHYWNKETKECWDELSRLLKNASKQCHSERSEESRLVITGLTRFLVAFGSSE